MRRVLIAFGIVVGGACASIVQPPPTFDAVASGSFEVVCEYSHSAPDDPIVHPGMAGASHAHDFFGNVSTTASSTVGTLDAGGTTCRRPQDRSAYWAPTLVYRGTPVTPMTVHVYYNNDHRAGTQTLPHGLKIVAGDALATGPQDTHIVAWKCDESPDNISYSAPPVCSTTGRPLKMIVRFPGCWDGEHLDSPDHKSHMAYAFGGSHTGSCPVRYPVKVPTVNVEFKYPTRDGSGVTLSSGSPYTAHADFFNVWDPPTLQHLVTSCADALVQCGVNGP
jgi:hypothetical protein